MTQIYMLECNDNVHIFPENCIVDLQQDSAFSFSPKAAPTFVSSTALYTDHKK